MYKHRRNFGLQLGTTKVAAMVAVATVVAGGSFAFTASNTVAVTPAGQSESGAVSGYTSTNNVWTIDPADQTKLQKVEFDLSTVTAATKTYAGADNGTTIQWSSLCSQGTISSGSAHETCTFATEPPVDTLSKLAISAAN